MPTVRILRVVLAVAEDAAPDVARFYGTDLGLAPNNAVEGPGLRAGETTICFRPVADARPFYHYALRVPHNRFAAAREWLASRTELLPNAGTDADTVHFGWWNADACYAHDPAGNIVELIAHHELPEESRQRGAFTASELLGVCELGLVGPDVRALAASLDEIGIGLWDGTLDPPDALAFTGGRDGTLILAPVGRGWMPTGRPAEMHPVTAIVAGRRNAQARLPGTPHRVSTVAVS